MFRGVQLAAARFARRTSPSFFSAKSMSSSVSKVPLLLSPDQIAPLGDTVSILDASWFMPNIPRNPKDEFLSKRIPNAQFLDLDQVASSHELGLKHMMPEGRVFADACERFGIQPDSHVVIYDSQGIFSSPRALFMFRSFGHTKSSILDGGLPRWEAEGHTVTRDTPLGLAAQTNYPTPTLQPVIESYEEIVSNSVKDPADLSAELVVDARPHGRYLGTDPEPRPGLSSGHIPNSFSLPFTVFLKKNIAPDGTEYTTFLPPSELRAALVNAVGPELAEALIRGEKPVVTSCGSGMTAGVLWLGLKLLEVDNVKLYDESWTGYASRNSSRIEKVQ